MSASQSFDQPVYFTRRGVDLIKARLAELEQKLAQKQLEMGESGRADMDLRENRHFLDLRIEVMYGYPQQISELKQIVSSAIILEDDEEYKNLAVDTVWIGCSVSVHHSLSHEEEVWTILGWGEADPDINVITYSSPLAQALLNKKAGETIIFRGEPLTITSVSKVLG